MAEHLTSAQVATRWSISPRTVRRMAERGTLPGLRVGDTWRFRLDAVEAYEGAHTSGSISSPSNEGRKEEAAPREEVQRTTTADGFTLPADYVPVFPELWPGHEPRADKKGALSSR